MIPRSSEYKEKSILIIRLDAIGDYILFRNYLQLLKEHPKFSDHKITLVGNKAWRSIAEEFDSQFIDSFIWVDRNNFLSVLRYTRDILTTISKTKYDIAIHPVFSREFNLGDLIIYFTNAYRKIGFLGDSYNIQHSKDLSNLFYTELIPHQESVKFEFERNRDFFDFLLKTTLKIEKPFFSFSPPSNKDRSAVIFIGASHHSRKWSIQNYAAVAQFIQDSWGLEIILCGGPNDLADAFNFESLFTGRFKNLVGKLSLAELIYTINQSIFFLSNETGAAHMAASLKTPNIFIISNGNHLKRFCPHPQLDSYHLILPDIVQHNYENFIHLSNQRGFEPPDINSISIEKCIETLKLKYHGATQ